MNKKLILIVVAILLIGGGVGAYFLLPNRAKAPVTQMESQAISTPAPTPAKKSLKDLLSAGIAQKCTYTSPEGNGGTVSISNGKMRGDFTATTDEVQVLSHMIVDGQTSYIWTDNQNMGFKMTFDSSAQTPSGSPDSKVRAQGQMDANQQVNVDCSPWVVDPSVFTLPAGVKFSDFGAFALPTGGVSAGTEGAVGTDLKTQQCAACDSVPAASQTQCKAALGCQ
jgi:hypothetical protein